MNLIGCRIFQTGSYNQQLRRAFTTQVDASVISQLDELTNGGRNLSRAAIAPVAAQVLTPSASPIGQAIINGGWDNHRCRIVFEFEQPGFNGAKMRKVVTGYTDHLGINPGTNSIDPNMRIYINQVVDLIDSVVPTPHGHAIHTAIRDCDQIIMGNYDRNGRLPNDYAMRPADIFNTASSQTSIMNYVGDGSYIDLSNTFVNGAVRSRRDNLNPTGYMHRLLRAANEARTLQDDNAPDTLQSINDDAAGIVNDKPWSGDTVLRELSKSFDYNKRGYVTWRDLVTRWPQLTVAGFVKASLFGGVHARRQMHAAGQTERWDGNGPETIVATMLGGSLPGLLTANMIYRIGLYIHNTGAGGIPEVLVTIPPVSLSNAEVPIEYVERLKMQIVTELMPGITANGWRQVAVTCDVDVMDEIRIGISINSGPIIDYVVPCFADNTFSLVMTNNMDTVYAISADVTNLSNNLTGGAAPNMYEPASTIFTGSAAYRPPQPTAQPQQHNEPTGVNRWRI